MELSDAEYRQRLKQYREDLKHPSNEVVHKHILTGTPAVLSVDDYFLLRNRVANTLGVQPVEVVLVGSCRTGFTIVDKSTEDRPRYSPVRSGSDLDIAIVSARLFDNFWQDVLNYSDTDRAFAGTPEAGVFKECLFGGWIDPRGLPPSRQLARAQSCFQLFRQITQDRQYGNRRASGRVYRTWEQLAAYQRRAVDQCKRELSR
jgi:hypothetical protein